MSISRREVPVKRVYNVNMAVNIKRVYDPPATSDGYRVLVDRLWPRGVSKDKAHVDQWLKEVGPSNELRQWFNHDPAKFTEFSRRYKAELAKNPAAKELKDLTRRHKTLTLVYSAKDPDHNQAVVLKDYFAE